MRSLSTYMTVPREYLALLAEIDMLDHPPGVSGPLVVPPDSATASHWTSTPRAGGAADGARRPRALRPI